jgi:hypothetical protein
VNTALISYKTILIILKVLKHFKEIKALMPYFMSEQAGHPLPSVGSPRLRLSGRPETISGWELSLILLVKMTLGLSS